MSHAIGYYTCKNRDEIWGICADFANENVDRLEDPFGSYHGGMTINDDIILNSYNEAKDWIESHQRRDYDDRAVRFRQNSTPSAKMKSLKNRIEKEEEKRDDFIKAKSIKNYKSKLVTCPKCGSKINKEYTNRYCPVCRADMFAKSTVDKIKFYNDKIKRLNNELEEAEKQNNKHAKTVWLVKVEVHC